MKITKDMLKTLWYEDENGNEIEVSEEFACPENATFQVSRFPFQLTETHLKLIKQEDVDKCKHPRKYIKPTYGWVDGVVGRKCELCHGTQLKKKGLFHLWPEKWDGGGSRAVFEGHQGWNQELVMAIAKSGDYTLNESIIIAATSCERCMNALAFKYGLEWGYEEGSEEWKKCGTSCKFCNEE